MASPLLGIDALPHEVTLGGRAYPIASDYRDGIRFETMMCDESVLEEQKVALAINIYFGAMPAADLKEIIDAMLDFYRCGKPEVDYESDHDGALFSYTHDYDTIYAGFLAAYGIDLLDPATELHWFKFRAMLTALPKESQFMQVVGYRATEITSDMAPEEKRFIRKMQRIYALPETASMRPVRLTDDEAVDAAIAAVMAAKRAAREAAQSE